MICTFGYLLIIIYSKINFLNIFILYILRYMIILIFDKWSTDYSLNVHAAPSIITELISKPLNFFLKVHFYYSSKIQ